MCPRRKPKGSSWKFRVTEGHSGSVEPGQVGLHERAPRGNHEITMGVICDLAAVAVVRVSLDVLITPHLPVWGRVTSCSVLLTFSLEKYISQMC